MDLNFSVAFLVFFKSSNIYFSFNLILMHITFNWFIFKTFCLVAWPPKNDFVSIKDVKHLPEIFFWILLLIFRAVISSESFGVSFRVLRRYSFPFSLCFFVFFFSLKARSVKRHLSKTRKLDHS